MWWGFGEKLKGLLQTDLTILPKTEVEKMNRNWGTGGKHYRIIGFRMKPTVLAVKDMPCDKSSVGFGSKYGRHRYLQVGGILQISSLYD